MDHRAIAQLALRQHGAFSHAQAVEAGATKAAVRLEVATGRWLRATRSVFVLAGFPPSIAQRAMVAILARPAAHASHRTAAHLAGWVQTSPHLPTLTVPLHATARSAIASIHRACLLPHEVTTIAGVPATSAPRTIVDLASTLGPVQLRRVVDQALHQGATSAPANERQLARATRLTSAQRSALVAIVDVWSGPIRPGSAGEARLLRCIDAWGHPTPELQVPMVDEDGTTIARIDGGWRGPRIGFEFDGLRFHGALQWASDEERHRAVERLGWTLLHADRADLRPGERAFRDALQRAWDRADHSAA